MDIDIERLSIIIGIIAVLLSGMWFLILRSKSAGAKDEKLDALTDAVKNLQVELKADINKLDVKIDTLDSKIDRVDEKIDRVQADLKK
ncbi:MAG: hypothetical protein LBL13_05845 [Bacteroidales bacterium]|jgi:peptidoglycan hydrolase CwlO-like protein|nr:hypothetical protein [Bacteroidales bacterium]